MNRIKALILDAGGVLVHPCHGDWNIPVKYREYLKEYAADVSSEKWREACRAEAEYLREDILIRNIEEEYALRLKFLTAVAKRMDWALSTETLTSLAEDFTYNPARYAWYDDALPWLKRWRKRLPVGILSDAMPSFSRMMHAHEAYRCLEAMVVSTEIGTAKPDARMYSEICMQMKVLPEECLFADDRVCNLEGAINSGMRAVQMCRDGLEEWNGDVVHDLCELNDYLEELL